MTSFESSVHTITQEKDLLKFLAEQPPTQGGGWGLNDLYYLHYKVSALLLLRNNNRNWFELFSRTRWRSWLFSAFSRTSLLIRQILRTLSLTSGECCCQSCRCIAAESPRVALLFVCLEYIVFFNFFCLGLLFQRKVSFKGGREIEFRWSINMEDKSLR